MAALIIKHNELSRQLAEIKIQLESIEASPQFAAEREFQDKLIILMRENNKSLADVVLILDPQASLVNAPVGSKAPRARAVVITVYKNPATGEEVIFRGGNNRKLKAWREQHGFDTVESWKQS